MNKDIIFRCSSLGDLLSDGRGDSRADKIAKKRVEVTELAAKVEADIANGKSHLKTSEARADKLARLTAELKDLVSTPETADERLGDTAKSKCRSVVLEQIYGALEEVESDATRHGKLFEPEAVRQYGELIGANRGRAHAQFRKNTERRTLKLGTEAHPFFLTGEPDVVYKDRIWEFKCPFSISSFDAQCRNAVADYILQVQGYMLLFDLDKATIVTSLFRNKNIKSDKIFDNTKRCHRFHAREVERDDELITKIVERLALCADWVRDYRDEFHKNAGFYKYLEYRNL